MPKLSDSPTNPECYYSAASGRYLYPHPGPNGGDWEVIYSPSPRGRWNTANKAVASAKDIRVANIIAKALSEIDLTK